MLGDDSPGRRRLERIVPIGIDVLRHEIKRAQIATLYTSWFADRGPIDAKPKPTPRRSKRAQVIAELSASGLQGLDYCRAMDKARISVPIEWREDGCPAKYTAAYLNGPRSKKRIQQEKWRNSRKP